MKEFSSIPQIFSTWLRELSSWQLLKRVTKSQETKREQDKVLTSPVLGEIKGNEKLEVGFGKKMSS